MTTPDKPDGHSLHHNGDMALLVSFGDRYAPHINNAVMAFDRAFSDMLPLGVIETTPTFRSLLIHFDPAQLDFEKLSDICNDLLASRDWFTSKPPEHRRKWVIPVTYGGTRGPDLGEVADLMGLREDQVIDSHAGAILQVAMLGFSPGLAYLGQLPEVWQFPRRTEVTPAVPAGAILVAVRQTVMPSTEIPTGWRQIGQTPFRSFDVAAKTPFLLSPGDEVRFEPISEADYQSFSMDRILRETEL